MTGIRLRFEEIEALARRALEACDVSPDNARPVARSIAAAERDGQPLVGLSYLPVYCDHAACGKVKGRAVPALTAPAASAIRVDARSGFAHPALALALPALAEMARRQGLAGLAIGNSYACGSLGYFVEELAAQGLVALMFANASPSIAPYGGKVPVFGANPIAFATPRRNAAPLVVDQSSSVVAPAAVIEAHRRGVALPEGWALDRDGTPTTDPAAALAGSLQPIGGYKGFGLALMVEVLTAGLGSSNFSFEASSFGDGEGGPPRTGQFVLAIEPTVFGGKDFPTRVEMLLGAAAAEPDVRLPGARRLQARQAHEAGIPVRPDLVDLLETYARMGSQARRP